MRENRARFVAVLQGLSEQDWEKTAQSALMGMVTLEQQAVFVSTHDGYHAGEIAQWLEAANQASNRS